MWGGDQGGDHLEVSVHPHFGGCSMSVLSGKEINLLNWILDAKRCFSCGLYPVVDREMLRWELGKQMD